MARPTSSPSTPDSRARPPVPTTLDEALSPEWLTAALGSRFHAVEVRAVTPGPVVSRISTNARFRIECTSPAPDGLPVDLCLKGYFGEHAEAARPAGVPEALFYRDLAAATGVRTLTSVYADVDAASSANVVITADVVAGGGRFLDPLGPYTVDQAAESLEQLATLHAATWMDPTVGATTWLDPWFARLGQSRGVTAIERNFGGPIGAGVPEAVRDPQRLYDGFVAVAAEATAAAPWCVVHGDPHAANLYLDGHGRPSLVDWQLVQRGPWWVDVGYHVAATLSVEDRRRSERDLVEHYLARLRAAGVDPGSEGDVSRGLRRGMVHGFYLWGITLMVDPAITTVLLERLGTAVDDHAALDAQR